MHIPTGATLAYPPGWHRTRGDAGTATAVLTGSDGRIVGYLNLTPRQAAETPANWATFRPHHNAQEGDRNVVTLASAGGLRFRTGRGACIRDRYTTSSGSTYIELACIVGGRTTSVIVGAASPSDWARMAPTIERSISALTT